MNAPLEMTEHISDSELAAVVEHGIEHADRRVVEHLAECGECSEALMMASDVRDELSEGGEVVHPEFDRGRAAWWKVLGSAAVLAGALYLVMGYSRWMKPHGTQALAEASKSVQLRATDGRLSEFPYQKRSTKRGPAEEEDLATLVVDGVVAKILREPDADPHATGVAYLVLNGGQGRAFAGVSSYFDKALAQAKKPEERRAIVNDYAVALVDQGGDADLVKALGLLEAEWKKEQTPEIAFNRALVLDRMSRYKEALAAYDDYLRLDSTSEWAADVRRSRDLLLDLNPQLGRP